MLGLWPYIEADFQRDYAIDLSCGVFLKTMSWRRFSTLLHGLNPRGAVAMNYESVAKRERQESGDSDAGADNFWRYISMTSRPSGDKGK